MLDQERQRSKRLRRDGEARNLSGICRESKMTTIMRQIEKIPGAKGNAVMAGPCLTQLEGRVGHVNGKVVQ